MPKPFKIDDLTKSWKRLQSQKFSKTGNVEARVLENICYAHGEHVYVRGGVLRQSEKDRHLVNLNLNLIGPRMRKLGGRLSSVAPTFKAQPDGKDPKKLAQAEVVDNLIVALDQKLDQPSKTREILEWMMLGGVAFEHITWVGDKGLEPMPQFDESGNLLFKDTHAPEGEGILPHSMVEFMVAQGAPQERFEVYEEIQQTGDIETEILGPLSVFVDHSVKSLDKLGPDQPVMVALPMTVDWVKEKFAGTADKAKLKQLTGDRDIRIVMTDMAQAGDSLSGVNLKQLLPAVQGSPAEDDPPMVPVVWCYYARSKENPKGRYVVFIPGKFILLDFKDEEGDLASPYVELPLVDYHWQPVTTTFWNGDYVSDLKVIQKAFSRAVSDMREYANAFVKAPWLLGGSLTEDDFGESDVPRLIPKGIGPDGQRLVQQADVAQIPGWFVQSIEQLKDFFDDVAGGIDLTRQKRFPGQLRGPMAVPMMQEILDSEWGPLYEHLGERMAKAKQLRINLVKAFYEPVRTLHYTDKALKSEVLEFHTEEILRSGTEYNITVERGSLVPELRAMREARIIERINNLPMLYQDQRTGVWDVGKIAADLKFGDVGREGKEAQARKLAMQIIDRLWEAKPVPAVTPLMDFAQMIDEFQSVMTTDEFLGASEQIQQGFYDYWGQLANAAFQQQQQAAQQAQQQNIEGIVNQAAQQAAAAVAADVAEMTRNTIFTGLAQAQAQGVDLNQMLASAEPRQTF